VEALLELEETEATFEQLPYLLAAGVENLVTGVADGGGSGKIYQYDFPTTSKNTIKTYTVEGGDDQEKEEFSYGFVETFKLSGKGGEAMKMSGKVRGRQVAVGVSISGTGIAFVAATKKVINASGLAIFLTGTTIKVSGSTSNDGIYTVATGGVAGEIVVTEALADESAGATVTVRDWFSGGPTGIALPTVEEILFSKGLLYIDAVGGTIGTTLKSNVFLGMELDCKTGWIPVFSADGQVYFAFAKSTEPELTISITFEHDGSSMAEKVHWRANTARQMRLRWPGSTLGTAGTTYSTKVLNVDVAGKWESFSKLDEQDGNDIVTGVFRARYNSTAAKYAQMIVVNELTALP
jgi:hypothetical protein